MKKIFYIITLFTATLFFSSCEDLEQEPKSFFPVKEYFELGGASSAEKFADGLYRSLWQGNYGYNCRIMRINAGADDITSVKDNDLKHLRDLEPQIDGNKADWETTWGLFTKVIYDANTLIEYAQPKITLVLDSEIEAEEALIAKYKAEAEFMRAFAYFSLIRLYGQAPLILENDRDASPQMPLSTPAEIYDQVILPSLEVAVRDLPEKSRKGDSSRPTKWAAKALRADVYMTMAGWPLKRTEYYAKAAAEAKEIIDAKTKAGLSLTPKYEDLWKEANKTKTNEFMFTIIHSVSGKNASQYGKSFYPNDFYPNAGWADYYGDLDFYNNYPEDDRKAWNYMTEWPVKDGDTSKIISFENSYSGLPAISKYYNYDNGDPGKSAQSNGVTSIYRYADVLLMYAEASNLATGTVSNEALAALNEVQKRANSTITSTTNSAEFDKAVIDEKGWEFLAEFRRWYDLARREKLSEVRADKWDASIFKANNHYYFPIPAKEIELTGWVNNPGY